MSLKDNFILMANYNEQMNRGIYNAVSSISADDFTQNRGAFFGSISGTLNHILVGDTIWLKRFAQHPSPLKSLDTLNTLPAPTNLDTILFSDFEALKQAREQIDQVITLFSQELTDDLLSSSLTYKNTKGDTFTKNFGSLIQHLFNHQTHHRGQVSTLLSQMGIDIGVTDLLVYISD